MTRETTPNSENIPTKEDWWTETDDMDTDYAYRRFFGKSIDQGMDYFHEAVLGAAEDINWMPPVPFRFYIRAYTKFLLEAPIEQGADIDSEYSNGASSFLRLVLNKLEEAPEIILPIMDELMVTCEHVAANQAGFDASEDIYGSFEETLNKIKAAHADALKQQSKGTS
jgi:hypothetical protein